MARHGGRVVKLMGDGALVVFDSALQAVRCALDLQQPERNGDALAQGQGESPFTLRLGINRGEIVFEDGDIFGDEVNVSARLEGMAPAGGVLISQAVWQDVQGRLGVAFHDNGLRKFKNIARAIQVWSWPEKLPSARADQKPRVHLEVFAGSSPSECQLAADLDADIRARLARLTGLEVTPMATQTPPPVATSNSPT